MKTKLLTLIIAAVLLVSLSSIPAQVASASEQLFAITCCDRMNKGESFNEYHSNAVYGRLCDVERYKSVVCRNCGTVWIAHEVVTTYSHTHGID